MSLVLIFVAKYQFGLSICFYLNLVSNLENSMQSSHFREWCSNNIKENVTCQFLNFIYLFFYWFFI